MENRLKTISKILDFKTQFITKMKATIRAWVVGLTDWEGWLAGSESIVSEIAFTISQVTTLFLGVSSVK